MNCDSNFGIETNTWNLINKKFGVMFHIGDFLYNESIKSIIFIQIKMKK